jgi:NAD(P)-dependent dehydrogenase (short-subunit alcohol dehydrogenase family)
MVEEVGARALAVRCDVSRAEEVKAALDETVEEFGRLDFAFNNAGVEQRNCSPTPFRLGARGRVARVWIM